VGGVVMTIGERIKARRIELNLTQDELAKKAGYKSRSSINKLESSRTLPSRKIEKMAEALETTPAYLMGWDMEEITKQFKQDMISLESKKNPDAVFQRMTTYDDELLHSTELTNEELKMIKQYRQTTPDYKKVIYGVVMNAPKKEVDPFSSFPETH
jgi:transcriptional regulator with XRE-family HTH domain